MFYNSQKKKVGGVPKVKTYAFSIHARLISLWVAGRVEYDEMPRLEIEATFCKPFSLVNILDKRGKELPFMIKDSFLITNIIDTLVTCGKSLRKPTYLSLLTLVNNPDLVA